jgi:2-aminoadipate transaminase
LALMNDEIVNTLGELERKLGELERVLSAMDPAEPGGEDSNRRESESTGGERSLAPHAGASTSSTSSAASRLIDEAVEREESVAGQAGGRRPRADVSAGAPSISETSPPPAARATPAPAADLGVGAVSGPSAPAGPAHSAELLRFRDRLERMARELTNDYNELLGRLAETPAARPSPPRGPSISFARGAPSLDIIDVQGLKDASVRALESDPGGATAYGTSVGYPRLRAWIADRHGVEPERVLVTNGSMQADAFLFEHLVRDGDDVIVERPSYDRTLLSLRARGARLHAVALEPDGIDTDALARLLGGGHVLPKLAHIIPNFQNPAGYTLSLAKREELLALAADYEFLVFEDDPYVALRFRGESLPTMLSMDPDRVVYASSFSKTVCPGVRVGYLVGPPALIDAVSALARDTYISPSMLAQAVVYEFCASGAIERSIETVRSALQERAQTLADALRRELPQAEFTAPDGGYFMWVTLPTGTDVAAMHHAAEEVGVSFVKGSDFLLVGGENTMRLAFAGVTPKQIDDGVARLAAAYRAVT